MIRTTLACALLLATASVSAKDKTIPLSAADASALSGKTVAVTLHERPGFMAMTAGKAGLVGGLLGAGLMYAAGNDLVRENEIHDPGELVRSNLVTSLGAAYGANVLATDTTETKAKKPKDIAATHPDADYVLDVRSLGWMYAYYPTKWGTYWVGYSVQAQLVDAKSARVVSNAVCNVDTRENKNPPSREQLHADKAQLLKDVTTSLGWTCVQMLSKDQFHFAADQVAVTPTQYVDPLAAAAQTALIAAAAAGNAPAGDASAASATAAAAPAATTGAAPAADAKKENSGAGGSPR